MISAQAGPRRGRFVVPSCAAAPRCDTWITYGTDCGRRPAIGLAVNRPVATRDIQSGIIMLGNTSWSTYSEPYLVKLKQLHIGVDSAQIQERAPALQLARDSVRSFSI
jgi:hypothetical protein